MEEKKKRLIAETINNLKRLDAVSLQIMKSNAEVLRARDAIENRKAG